MIPHHYLTLMFLAFFVTSASAENDAKAQLAAAKSLKCHFGPGAEAQWKGNKPAVGSCT